MCIYVLSNDVYSNLGAWGGGRGAGLLLKFISREQREGRENAIESTWVDYLITTYHHYTHIRGSAGVGRLKFFRTDIPISFVSRLDMDDTRPRTRCDGGLEGPRVMDYEYDHDGREAVYNFVRLVFIFRHRIA